MGTLTMSAVTLGAILVTRTRIGTVLAAIPVAIPVTIPMTASLLTPATGVTAPAIATLRLPVFRSTIRVFAGMTATIPPAIAWPCPSSACPSSACIRLACTSPARPRLARPGFARPSPAPPGR
ncbi:MAG: hypothetical protein J0H89_03490, partial [Rhizobiales bacterium]|nr:hypothetical protein [Hyphomicrobiales bacterium]